MRTRRIRWSYPSGEGGVLVGRFLGPCFPLSEGMRYGWGSAAWPAEDDGKAIYIEVEEPTVVAGQPIPAYAFWAGDPRGVYDDVETGVRMYAPDADAPGMPARAAAWLRAQRRWPRYAPAPPTPTRPDPPRAVRVKYTIEAEFDLESMSHYRRPDGDYYTDEGEPITLEAYSSERLDELLDECGIDREAHVHVTKQEIFIAGVHTVDHEGATEHDA